MIDNAYVEGSSTPIARTDEHGNTYQVRQLKDGSRHEILKNFPSPADMKRYLDGYAEEIEVTSLNYYWIAKYRRR
jgi:demethylmenaquinone methyltransferase/2-methoxy-6-polyprenyl-1,4-benzoquinol methylase